MVRTLVKYHTDGGRALFPNAECDWHWSLGHSFLLRAYRCHESHQSNNEGEVGLKLSFTMKAQRGHKGIAPISLKLYARRRSVVNVTLRPLYPRGRTVTPIAVQVGWDTAPVWTCSEIGKSPLSGIRTPVRSVRSLQAIRTNSIPASTTRIRFPLGAKVFLFIHMYKANIGPTHIQGVSVRWGNVITANGRLMNSHVNAVWNNGTNGALRDAVNSLYESVLYFQNVTRFHCTRVDETSLTPMQEQGLSCVDFHAAHRRSTALCRDLLLRNALKEDKNGKTGKDMLQKFKNSLCLRP